MFNGWEFVPRERYELFALPWINGGVQGGEIYTKKKILIAYTFVFIRSQPAMNTMLSMTSMLSGGDRMSPE
jgi:hypothetical protein